MVYLRIPLCVTVTMVSVVDKLDAAYRPRTSAARVGTEA